MATLDKMMVDDRDLANRYFGENSLSDLDTDQFLFSKQSKPNHSDLNSKPTTKQQSNNKDDDLSGLFGRRVYLESPSFDNKEEEDMYRYVPSRLSEAPISAIEAAAPNVTTDTLIDSLDFELDIFGATNTRNGIPYRTNTQFLRGPAPLTQWKNPSKPPPPTTTDLQRADPREDPLLGPLLAELDAMTTQQPFVPQSAPVPMYRRNSVPYDPNHTRPPVPSRSNHALTTTANRTVNDALFEAELYDSLDPQNQSIPPIQERKHVPLSAPNLSSSNHSQPQPLLRFPTRPLNMNNIDVFMPSSYDKGTGVFSAPYGTNDQLFQQPLLNALGQNYVSNGRPPIPPQQQQQQQQHQQPQLEQRDKSYDDIYSRMSPPHRSAHAPSQQPPNNNNQYQQQQQQQPFPPSSFHQQPQYEQQDTNFNGLYSQMSPPRRASYMPNNNHYQQQQQQSVPPPPSNPQNTYNNNNSNNDPFSEFQDLFTSSQYRRPSQAPPQQYPSPSQQQMMMPPPSFQQAKIMPPIPPSSQQARAMLPPSSQQPRMMPPPPSSFQQQGMTPSYQPQTTMPPPPSSSSALYQQPRMVPPPPPPPPSVPAFQQPRMMPPIPPSSQQYRMMPPPPSSQQTRMPSPSFPQQQQHQPGEHQIFPPSPPQQYYEDESVNPPYPSNNQDLFFTDINDDQFDQTPYQQQNHPQQQQQQQQQTSPLANQHQMDQQEDQDSKRKAIWNELQRTNAKVQEKNAKKRQSANRREQILKGTYSASNIWNSGSSKQSSAQSKSGSYSPPARRPPPIPVSKTNYIDDNIDMIKNKENFYHRYPAKKYEALYSKRKDLSTGGNNTQQNGNQNAHTNFDQTPSSTSINNVTATYSDAEHRSNLPVSINLNPANNQHSDTHPATVTIPLDSHVTRVGDKISVNIDVRLVDLHNMKQQQNDHPDWTSLDPLDRHIRKLENSIDRSLPPTHSPTQRSAPLSNPTVNPSMGRYGKTTIGAGQFGYSPPNYKADHYSYSTKGREEDSYLSKMTQVKKPIQYKPYTGRDYEQLKKNTGFGTGHLGFDYDNPEYREKNDKTTKTKEYAQQIEARNKKILADAPRRTLSETRKPSETSATQRAIEYARVSTRHKLPLESAAHSSPPYRDEPAPLLRRPTEVPHPPPPVQRQRTKVPQNQDNELIERLAMRHERDKAQVQGILNPSQKRREPLFDDDDRRTSDIEKLAQDRANQRRLSPPKLPPTGPTNNGNARRPLRFDKPLLPDEPTQPVQQQQQQQRPIQQQQSSALPPPPVQQHQPAPQQQSNVVDELANRHKDEKVLMEAIRQELSERPLDDDEELVVVEQ